MSILVFIKTNLFPISVFSAIASFIVLTTISTILSTDYNFISETISALGKSNQKHDWILMVTGITYSILIQGLIPLFYFSSKSMETKIIILKVEISNKKDK